MTDRTGISTGKRVKNMILGIVIAILAFFAVLLLLLWIWSPGKTAPFPDTDGNIIEGSISERTKVTIGGIEQGMIIQSKNNQNPVLLFLHGGPGNPEYILAKNYDIGLEDHFTVPAVEIPVYFFHGIYDLQVSYDLSKEYFDLLDAPQKAFYSFEESAHSPFMEEPEKFIDILAGIK